MATYIAVIEKSDTAYGISFPQFPGCISAGDTAEEAYQKGTEALRFHIEGMKEDGENVPESFHLRSVEI